MVHCGQQERRDNDRISRNPLFEHGLFGEFTIDGLGYPSNLSAEGVVLAVKLQSPIVPKQPCYPWFVLHDNRSLTFSISSYVKIKESP